MKNNKQKVFVGVSGGVDSALSLALLKDKGYDVVGVFIRTWTPDFIECTWRDERRDAMRICAYLGVPFLECDAEVAYKEGVADYMISEYKKGNTPNPDVMCNREVKFGVFWDFAKSHGADFIATGHYAINKDNTLIKSPDISKDQSYFLYRLNSDDLSHIIFPIGHLHKSEVRKLAEKYKLPNAKKKDSQGVCFLGPLDMKDFLKHYIESKIGDVLDTDGNIIGTHEGAVFYTIGERHGFMINKTHTKQDKIQAKQHENTPMYVVSKDINKNTITVSSLISARGALGESKKDKVYELEQTTWVNKIPDENKKYQAQIRYHGELLECSIKIKQNNNTDVIFTKPILVSSGQSIVIYDNEVCLGGGVVV